VKPPLKQEKVAYVKALPLSNLDDLPKIKSEIRLGNIVIIRITPLAKKSVEETKIAINDLCDYVKAEGGDIARLGEERIVITPASVKIWRGKPAAESSGTGKSKLSASGPAGKELSISA